MKKLAAKKKINSGEVQISANVEQRFSKAQILSSAQYANRRDLVDALLDVEKRYTKKEVDELINKFMKGTVR